VTSRRCDVMPCGITALWRDVITTGVGGNPQCNHNSTKVILDGSNAGMIHHNLGSMGAWSDIAFTLLADPIQAILGWSHGTIWGLRLDEHIGVHNMTGWRDFDATEQCDVARMDDVMTYGMSQGGFIPIELHPVANWTWEAKPGFRLWWAEMGQNPFWA
jgi:hypothetical protein